ncbi:universal stress protein [Kiloniella sp. b19]|uniref:universal stress protein n=1 Tax=Kiloniella sp. GXU_MW_B19 TaxID=3141326 RepID=UPI0031D70895
MYKRIILSLSLAHGFAPKALTVARNLCAEGGEIVAVHVYEMPSGSVKAFLDEELVRQAYAEAKQRLHDKVGNEGDVQAVMLTGHSARAIMDYADETQADLIIVGSHMPGLSDYFLGSTASRIVRHAGCDVHVLRHPEE